jgi:hypothetical protein
MVCTRPEVLQVTHQVAPKAAVHPAHKPAVVEYRWPEFLKQVADRASGFSFHWHNHDAAPGRCHLFHANIVLKSLFSDGKPCTIHAHHSPCRVEFAHDASR